jgi:AcrR family transcriptional regulator
MSPTQAERSNGTRRSILEAATELFGEHGYEATSIAEIATRAGVSTGAVYHHFGDKPTVLAEVYASLEQALAARLLAATGKAADPLDAVRTGSRRFLDECTDPTFRRIALIEAPAALGWERWRAIDAAGGGFGLLRMGLEAAAAAGTIDGADVHERSHLLLSMLMEAALLIAQSTEPEATHERARILIDDFIEAFRR